MVLNFRRHKHVASVLDLPVEQYDVATQLPARIQVGPYAVKPLVQISDVVDHLTILAAFADAAQREVDFRRFASHAAGEYEFWALSVLPHLRGARRSGDSPRSTGTPPINASGHPTPPIPGRSHTVPTAVGTPKLHIATGALVHSPTSSPLSSPSLPSPTPRTPLLTSELPPLPVLMAWHAHLLHPAHYAADTAPGETYAALAHTHFPLAAVAAALRTNTLPRALPHAPERHSHSISGWRVPDITVAVQQARALWIREGADTPRVQRAIVRYHAWLDLFAATRAPRLAPTPDIEMVWRTHQVRGAAFRAETAVVLGHSLDQEERGDHELRRYTARMWEKRFGQKYEKSVPRRPVRRSTV
ncbi:hypothetical protein CC85DRAFT_285798 [Cutaneotrichosporon oleaginosum]|uniref:Uncharacterized protein n=1 Tax=Cutaneotrichosporon oleaginosum TaxID=879819 RepID=A0A0J1B3I4_9TREE|nr:uncharacterized protein CC85DRAFT_285798 [Cutaneotrichosporon oleaginosum]KLT42209.1 hypothetical protein CC85DRAFT_285798 [Cutaneotrichosporon oleaginosum]TXT11672.1 hypothetical protein COLE_02082 [Cutaneotrichosporon oleaginosum]